MTFKITLQPCVYLVSRTAIHLPGIDQFLKDETSGKWNSTYVTVPSGDFLPELGGRLCYHSFDNPRPGGNQAYLDHIKEVGHGSVLEHTTIGVLITGISRSCSHELVRHRAGMAYSQRSQRYVDESEDPEYVLPWEYRDNQEMKDRWVEMMRYATKSYQIAVEKGVEDRKKKKYQEYVDAMTPLVAVPPIEEWWAGLDQPIKTHIRKAARGAARSFLPNATATKIMVTGNARAWRHFIEMRCHPAADAEIRLVAYKVYWVLVTTAPNLFGDYVEVPQADGTTALETAYRKV